MQKKVSFRSNRLATEIKRVLADFLLVDASEYEGIDPKRILITDVVVTPDLRYAKVFVSHLGNDQGNEKYLDFLEYHHGQLRHKIGMKIPLRYVPDLVFVEDRTEEYASNIDRLLKIASDRTSSN